MILYTFKKRNGTEEHHIFEGKRIGADHPYECTVPAKSICKKATGAASEYINNNCKDEQSARLVAAQLGRSVCGVCVSHLYTTPAD
ncbi:hypothetical protein NLO95_08795 [Pseudomonas syringae]|nr:hypothetical protein [Pseudomonas syringae]